MCLGQPVLVPLSAETSVWIFAFCYESHYAGCVFFVALASGDTDTVRKCPSTCAPAQNRQTLRCRTPPSPCTTSSSHPTVSCSCSFLLHLSLPYCSSRPSFLSCVFSPSLLSVLLYLYPNGFYHLRSYFTKLKDRPLLLGKCNKTTTLHYSSTQ